MRIIQAIVCFLVLQNASPARILSLFPIPAHSHYILGHTLNEALVAKGHQVTMISAFGYKNKGADLNYVHVVLEGMKEFMLQQEHLNTSMQGYDSISPFVAQLELNWAGFGIGEFVFNHTNVQKLLKDNQHFDLVISEQFFNDAMKGFCWHYGAPCIVLSTIGANQMCNYLVGNPSPPSYIPDFMLDYESPMSFLGRAYNFLFQTYSTVMYNLIFLTKHNDLLQKYFPGAPHVAELNKNVSLVLLNSHISINQPIPRVNNMIEVGGMHVKPPKQLPKDLQKYLDDAEEGVIYFSLGSIMKSSEMREEFKQVVLNVFSKLKYKVLWKYEDESFKNLPANVKIKSWLPQQDILGHKNIILFITHGGLLSTIEAVYNGIPVVGIPFYGDQKFNMQQAKQNEFGTYVLGKDLNKATFEDAIREVLEDMKYRKNARRISRLMHDRTMPPLDEAVWWVEHVMRHNGGDHLRNAGVDLTWYQYLMLDVLFVFTVLPVLAICVICKTIKSKKCEKGCVKKDLKVEKNE